MNTDEDGAELSCSFVCAKSVPHLWLNCIELESGRQAMQQPLLEIKDLNVGFDTDRGSIQPVRDVSISV